jgi:CDP-glucose 4,6-dehydratase
VLNPLSGYLLLAEQLWRSSSAARAWNFGPAPEDSRPVSWVVERLAELWDGAFRWERDEPAPAHEAQRLELDSSAAQRALGWRPAWDIDQALAQLVEWHRAEREGADMRALTLAQIERFARESRTAETAAAAR